MTSVRWWRRLDLRLALVVIGVLTLVGSGLVAWQQRQAQHDADAFMQWQSLNLAHYIAGRQPQPLVDAAGRFRPNALADTAMYIQMIHPALEAYLLDRDGTIVQHSLGLAVPALTRVDLDAVRTLLDLAPALPVYGDDPRRPGRRNLVSLAALPQSGPPRGYLYVVLRGEQAQLVQEQAGAGSSREAAWGITVAALGLSGLAILVVQWRVTSRLRRLAQRLHSFRPAGDVRPDSAPRGDEIDLVCEAVEALQLRIDQQFRRIEEADRARRELVTNISHDLHTPLASIQGYVETLLLQAGQHDAVAREAHLRTVLRHAQRVGRHVAELFELSKLESPRAEAVLEPFCMADLISDVVQGHRLAAEQRGVSLRLASDADRDALVLADIGLIDRVLQNLVDNALRHCTRGGWVELAVRADGEQVQVHVSDNGSGIAEADLPHIFERYWRAPAADVPETTAAADSPPAHAGLGLAIARRIVELHGSTLGVRSEPNRGADFSFALRRANAA
jgi:two-component system OmpR family sensor kinase